MFASKIMTTDVITCRPDQPVREVVDLLVAKHLRVIPVVDDNGKLVGSINTLSILNRIVPEYIVTGDLKSVPFAPDIGLLRKHFKALEDGGKQACDIMERNPTKVHEHESLLSVTAALITYDRFEYVLVVDHDDTLLGVISSGDILRALYAASPSDIERV